MKLRDMLGMSVKNLLKRKVRTSLTAAGVLIGTGAIVVMLSIGIGLTEGMNESIGQMGDITVIQIYNYNQSADRAKLNDEAIASIASMDQVVAVTPVYNVPWGSCVIESGKYRYDGSLYGVDMSAMESFGYQLENGSFPDDAERGNAVLFSSDALYSFFNTKKKSHNRVDPYPDQNGNIPKPYVDPLKDRLELQMMDEEGKTTGRPTKLVGTGVLTTDYSKTPSASYAAFVDLSLARELAKKIKTNGSSGGRGAQELNYDQAVVKTASVSDVQAVEQAIHDLGFPDTYSMETVRAPIQQMMNTIQLVLGGIGAVSLVVAALGILNTMIMSIYERTREIGVMKVLGCEVRHIRAMFLMEAGIIGLLGGILGLGVSYGASALINFFASSGGSGALGGILGMAGSVSTISVIPPWLAAGSVVFAVCVGVVSGILPANRAVKISALTAIRQDS